MSDYHSGYLVVLDHDIKEDYVEEIITALKMVKCVLTVTPVVADTMSYIAEARVRRELAEKIFDVLHPKEKK